MQLQKAQRQQVKLKIGIMGPSGSGKTYSSLLLAYGMCKDWNKIAIIDTENGSGSLYSHLGEYNTVNLQGPFTPERYVEAIEMCEKGGIEVIIIDSISHEWSGKGGCLDIHGAMTGNSFTNWAKITPRHTKFIDKILQSKCHIIGCLRVKQEYVITQNSNGRQVPEKMGLGAITREGMDYEFTLVIDIDIKHNATTSKDRTGLFMGKPEFIITSETGEKLKDWGDSGKEPIIEQIETLKKTTAEVNSKMLPNFGSESHLPMFKEMLAKGDYDNHSAEEIIQKLEQNCTVSDKAKEVLTKLIVSRIAETKLGVLEDFPDSEWTVKRAGFSPDEEPQLEEKIEIADINAIHAEKMKEGTLAGDNPEEFKKAQVTLKKELKKVKNVEN